MRDASISNDVMSQILGTSTSAITREPIAQDLFSVNGFKDDESIVGALKSFSNKTSYSKNLRAFVENECINKGINLSPHPKHHFKKWTDDQISIFSNTTHRDLWEYRKLLYKNGWIKVKQKAKNEKGHSWGFGNDGINKLLGSLPDKMAHKAFSILVNNMSDANEYFSCIDHVDELVDYTDEIFRDGSFLNSLYNIQEIGGGKGEVLVAFLTGGTTMGTSTKYDVMSANGQRIEIKAPTSDSSNRFGNKGVASQYDFYKVIIRTRNLCRDLVRQLGDEYKTCVSEQLYNLTTQLIKDGDYVNEEALSSAIDCGEINKTTLRKIKLFFILAHIEIQPYDGTYTVMQDVFNSQINVFGIDNNAKNIISALRSIEYVNDPLKFSIDMENAVKQCFEGVDALVMFRENRSTINIINSGDQISMDGISQNGLKIIEKSIKNKRKKDLEEEAFIKWQKNSHLNFYRQVYLPLLDEQKN